MMSLRFTIFASLMLEAGFPTSRVRGAIRRKMLPGRRIGARISGMKRLREGFWRARYLAILGLVFGTGLVGAVARPPQPCEAPALTLKDV